MSENTVSTPKWIFPAALGASLLAVVDSFYLAHLHTLRHTKELESTLCTISDVANCQITIESKYSELLGVPISYFSAVTYGLIAVVALLGLLDSRKPFPRLLLLGGAFTTLVSLVMAFLSYGVLKTICPACTLLYVLSILLLVTGVKAVSAAGTGETPGESVGDEFARFFAAKPLGLSAGVTAVILVILLVALKPKVTPVEAITRKDTAVAPAPGQAAKEPTPEEAMQLVEKYMGAMPQVKIDCGALQPDGNPDAKVTINEFADFQCPACKAFVPALKEIMETQKDKVRICFHNYPLDGECNNRIPKGRGHKDSCVAAATAICASRQGKMWDFYHTMFDMQGPGLNPESMHQLAKDKGLDMKEFDSCMKSDAVKQMISSDLDLGAQVGVEGTPTIIINGRRIRQRPDAALLKLIIEYENSK